MKAEFLDRVEDFSDRCVAVAEQIERDGHFRRLAEQLAASGSSVGANLFEASEAVSRNDFRRYLAIAAKELAETRFWIRLIIRRQWLPESRLIPLLEELHELHLIVGTMLRKTRTITAQSRTKPT